MTWYAIFFFKYWPSDYTKNICTSWQNIDWFSRNRETHMSKWIPKYPKLPGSRKEHDLEKVFNYLFNSVVTIRVITRTYKILWENIEQFSRNRGTYICQNEPIPWEEKFFNYFLVSVVTIRVIPTKVHENILNGSQETEEHCWHGPQNTPKWQSAEVYMTFVSVKWPSGYYYQAHLYTISW